MEWSVFVWPTDSGRSSLSLQNLSGGRILLQELCQGVLSCPVHAKNIFQCSLPCRTEKNVKVDSEEIGFAKICPVSFCIAKSRSVCASERPWRPRSFWPLMLRWGCCRLHRFLSGMHKDQNLQLSCSKSTTNGESDACSFEAVAKAYPARAVASWPDSCQHFPWVSRSRLRSWCWSAWWPSCPSHLDTGMLAFLGFRPQDPRVTGLGCRANVGLLQGNRTEVISEVVKALLRIHLESWFGFHRNPIHPRSHVTTTIFVP